MMKMLCCWRKIHSFEEFQTRDSVLILVHADEEAKCSPARKEEEEEEAACHEFNSRNMNSLFPRAWIDGDGIDNYNCGLEWG